MECRKRNEEKGGRLENQEHWGVQRRFAENGKRGESGTIERLQLFWYWMTLRKAHEFVELEAKFGKLGYVDAMDGLALWLAYLDLFIPPVVICFMKRAVVLALLETVGRQLR